MCHLNFNRVPVGNSLVFMFINSFFVIILPWKPITYVLVNCWKLNSSDFKLTSTGYASDMLIIGRKKWVLYTMFTIFHFAANAK